MKIYIPAATLAASSTGIAIHEIAGPWGVISVLLALAAWIIRRLIEEKDRLANRQFDVINAALERVSAVVEKDAAAHVSLTNAINDWRKDVEKTNDLLNRVRCVAELAAEELTEIAHPGRPHKAHGAST